MLIFLGRVLTRNGALPIIFLDSLKLKVLEDQINGGAL